MPCHVSVLKVLELLSIKPTRIYGTSAGAVIGGLYAAGMSTADLEEAMLSIKSADELFGFAAKHPGLRLVTAAVRRTFVRTTLDESGLYKLNRIEDYVKRTMERYIGGVPTLAELPLRFSCIATDIGTGLPEDAGKSRVRKVVFSAETTPDVLLSDAIGASMSIPGVITAKKISGRFHLDGAAVEHLPIATAYDDWRGARWPRRRIVILAVDLGYGGETIEQEKLVDPVNAVLYSVRLQERAITCHNLLKCHAPRHGCSVVLVRPRTVSVELHEVEKIAVLLRSAYEETVRQLAGSHFLSNTERAIELARHFLGLRPVR